MSEAETREVLKHASDCVEGECSLDDVSELLYVLKDTEKELEDRLEKIMNMVSHLQHINQKEERKTDEVRAFVSDLLRVFSNGVSDALCGSRDLYALQRRRSDRCLTLDFPFNSKPFPFPQDSPVISLKVVP